MISSGTSPLVRWTCSACGATTLVAKARNVSCTISMSSLRWRGPALVGERGDELGIAVGGDEVVGAASEAGSTPHSCSRPISLLTRSWTTSATNAHVIRASTSPLRAVVEQRLGGGDGRRRVGEVVGEDLVGVGAAEAVKLPDRACRPRGRRGRPRRCGGEIGPAGDVVIPPNIWSPCDRYSSFGRSPSVAGVRTWGDGCAMGMAVCVFCGSNVGRRPESFVGGCRDARRRAAPRGSPRLRRRPRRPDGCARRRRARRRRRGDRRDAARTRRA